MRHISRLVKKWFKNLNQVKHLDKIIEKLFKLWGI